MTAYYLPTMLTGETVMLVSNPASKEYVPIETEDLGTLGFKKAFLDGTPLPIPATASVNANRLYFQLYLNTKQQKWLDKMDTGRLFVPVALPRQELRQNEPPARPKKLYRRLGTQLHVVAFLSPGDFAQFDTQGRYQDYRLVHADRTESYVVNGVFLKLKEQNS